MLANNNGGAGMQLAADISSLAFSHGRNAIISLSMNRPVSFRKHAASDLILSWVVRNSTKQSFVEGSPIQGVKLYGKELLKKKKE